MSPRTDALDHPQILSPESQSLSGNKVSDLYHNGFQTTFQPETTPDALDGNKVVVSSNNTLYPDQLGLPQGLNAAGSPDNVLTIPQAHNGSDAFNTNGQWLNEALNPGGMSGDSNPNVFSVPRGLKDSTGTGSTTGSTTGDGSGSTTGSGTGDGSGTTAGNGGGDGTHHHYPPGAIVIDGNNDNVTIDGPPPKGPIIINGNNDTVTIDDQPQTPPPTPIPVSTPGDPSTGTNTGNGGGEIDYFEVPNPKPNSSSFNDSTGSPSSTPGNDSGHKHRGGVFIDGDNDTVTINGPEKGPVVVNGSNDKVTIDNQPPTIGDGGSGSGTGTGTGTGSGGGTSDSAILQQIEQQIQSLEQEFNQILQELGQLTGTGGGGGGTGGGGGGGDGGGGTGGGGGGTGGGGGGGGTGGGGGGGDGGGGTGTGGGGGTGTDMSSLFTAGDSGVSSAQLQHAIAIADALPPDVQQALLKGGVQMTLDSGFNGGPQGQNSGTQGQFYVDSGMADQAEVHELYEMAGQVDPSVLKGSWNDSTALGLADSALNGSMPGGNPGDLNDTVGNVNGDGDLMSNAFVADFFATHPGLNQDQVGQGVLQATAMDAPQLEQYMAQAFGLTDA